MVWLIANAVACLVTLLYYLIIAFGPTEDKWANYVLLLMNDFAATILFVIQAGSFHAPSVSKSTSASNEKKPSSSSVVVVELK